MIQFSIVTVSLNAGRALSHTVASVLSQNFDSWELIIQDGGSCDGSLEKLPQDPRIQIIQEKDTGIYDGMNRALSRVNGRYIQFLNAGDMLADKTVLSSISLSLDSEPDLAYCDYKNRAMSFVKRTPTKMSEINLFRAVFCHQVVFFNARLFRELGGYDLSYRIRADLEFLYRCCYQGKVTGRKIAVLGVVYDGDGFSAKSEIQKQKKAELEVIRNKYMPKWKCLLFNVLHELTLYRLRVWWHRRSADSASA